MSIVILLEPGAGMNFPVVYHPYRTAPFRTRHLPYRIQRVKTVRSFTYGAGVLAARHFVFPCDGAFHVRQYQPE